MRLVHAKSNVDNTNSIETRTASVQLNSTIVHVLSRDLYTKPIESMFREVLVNALDSHVEAGTTRPVDIKIPTAFDEVWYVRDYGTGIPHEKFMDIYMDYGNSTRRMSDDYTGAFGLGCKSPLAYKSAFQVNSYYDGFERLYLVYYNEDNIPQVDLRSVEPTDEPNGIKVSLTLNSVYDYGQFQAAAMVLLPRIPKELWNLVDGNSWYRPVEYAEDFLQYGKVKLIKNKQRQINIVMGYIAYTMDFNAVSKLLENVKLDVNIAGTFVPFLTVLRSVLQRYSVEIKAEFTDYPIHPSREYINVTSRAVKQLASDIQTAINKQFENLDQTFESDVLFYSFTNTAKTDWSDLKIKARIVNPSHYNWMDPNISSVIGDYSSLISALATSKQELIFAPLSHDHMVKYVGATRSKFKYPVAGFSDKVIIFYDNSLSGKFNEKLISATKFDFSTYAEAYIDVPDTTNYWSPSYRRIGKQDPLLKDKKHNVLIPVQRDGSYKRCWESQEHNVKSLKDLKVPVFYVPVSMGCLKDSKHLRLVEVYTTLKKLNIKNYPLVIGLPASKGTKAIKKAFEPIEQFELWVAQQITSDSFIRRMRMYVTKQLVIDSFNTLDTLGVADNYRPANILNRIWKSKGYNKADVFSRLFPELKEVEPFPIQHYISDVISKFPFVLFSRWFEDSADLALYKDQAKDWVKTVAKLTNNEVTRNV